jgi:hypothetical protein
MFVDNNRLIKCRQITIINVYAGLRPVLLSICIDGSIGAQMLLITKE